MTEHEQKAVELIQNVDEEDYERYAYMVMRSLRGSWSRPQVRIYILWQLCEETEIFDAETRGTILSKTDRFRRRYFDGWHDGRTFRPVYEGMDIDLSEEKARELSAYIPHDMTWDEFRFDRLEREAAEQDA